MNTAKRMLFEDERAYRNYKRRILRQRQIRQRVILTLAAVLVMLVFAFSWLSNTARADTGLEKLSLKYFDCIEVKYGDTLWDIAQTYGDAEHYKSTRDYMDEVAGINHLSSRELKAGQLLIVPYYSDAAVPEGLQNNY